MEARDLVLIILSIITIGMLLYNVGGHFLNKERSSYFEKGVNTTIEQLGKKITYDAVNCVPIRVPLDENRTLNLYDPEYCLGGR